MTNFVCTLMVACALVLQPAAARAQSTRASAVDSVNAHLRSAAKKKSSPKKTAVSARNGGIAKAANATPVLPSNPLAHATRTSDSTTAFPAAPARAATKAKKP